MRGVENGESSLRLVREMVIPTESEVVIEGQMEGGALYGSGLGLVGPAAMRAPGAGTLRGHCLNDTSSGDASQKAMNTSSEDVFMCEGMNVTLKSRVREDSTDSQSVLASVSKDSAPESIVDKAMMKCPLEWLLYYYTDKKTERLVRTCRSICFMLLCMLVHYITPSVLQCKKLCNFASMFRGHSVEKISYSLHAVISSLSGKFSKTKASADGPGLPCTVAYI